MSTDPRLEAYLAKMERVLGPFSASDRAEIIMEIKSHVLAALERDPQAQLDSILAALGEPETVANRYLMERGINPTKPPLSPFVKWIVIGFLGTGAMLMTFVAVVLFKFSPVFKVDSERDYVSVLGGLIEISGEEGTVRIGDSLFKGDEGNVPFGGSWTGSEKDRDKQTFQMKFKNGKVELKNSPDARFSWACRTNKLIEEPQPIVKGTDVVFDLSSLKGIKCEINLPKHTRAVLSGANGSIEVTEPHFHLETSLNNGKVAVSPDKGQAYQFDMSVNNGRVDSFQSSPDPKALKIAVHLNNGKISHSN